MCLLFVIGIIIAVKYKKHGKKRGIFKMCQVCILMHFL